MFCKYKRLKLEIKAFSFFEHLIIGHNEEKTGRALQFHRRICSSHVFHIRIILPGFYFQLRKLIFPKIIINHNAVEESASNLPQK